jgi:hypothetical protein
MRTNGHTVQAVLPLAAALWLCCGPAGSGEPLQAVGRSCIAGGTGDRVVRAFCRSGGSEAAGNVRAVLAKARKGSAERALYEGCLAEWQAPAGGYDWRMVEFCLQSAARADAPWCAVATKSGNSLKLRCLGRESRGSCRRIQVA